MKAILGRKVGMTQVFATDGTLIPVTVVEVLPNIVLQKKTIEKDGYESLKLGYEDKREQLATKPEKGQFVKANTSPKKFVREVKGDEMMKFNVGDKILSTIFDAGEIVDVIGTTKGKGFSGVIKRYNYQRGPSAHGSGSHRGVGTLATSGRTNNRIHPGRKMPGHHGNYTRTIQNLTVVQADESKNVILIKGAIPGPNRGLVTIQSAKKTQKNVPAAKTLINYEASAE
ncbi:MAG: 50S ribosomal protein L3 [Bacilli bacterium]|nr:50S ribosomal protein L3 [Bacilli bacterium]